jgi:adenylate cyclase
MTVAALGPWPLASSGPMGSRTESVRAVLRGEIGGDDLSATAAVSRWMITASIVTANVVGAAVVVVLLGVVLPLPSAARAGRGVVGVASSGAIAAAVYVVIAIVVGVLVGARLARPVIAFYASGRRPTESDRRDVLRLPSLLLRVQAGLWTVAVIVFGSAGFTTSPLYAFEVAFTVALGGIPTACVAYLLTQLLLRAGAAVVLADAPPRRGEVPGVLPRALLGWGLGVVPVGGAIVVAAFAPFTDMTLDALARTTVVLGVVAVAVGALATTLSARSVAEPLQQLRDAFARIERGDLDAAVPVFDATEVGSASAGFNRMAAGLREREQLRDLFGRQVGVDVARQALEQGVALGGEERQVAALFVDVIGSTTFASERAPAEVVHALNTFFAEVVGATQDHGGLVNKFLGDAALCIFGAPLAQADPTGAALAAARDMARRLAGHQLQAGIGVAFGPVVAGNIGTAERYEYTVIGDPVNEAARLTELAKQRPSRVLASWDAVARAHPDEARRWQAEESITLRGRNQETRLARPRAAEVEADGPPSISG